jgi:S1-C subfamily serine protease
MIMKTLIVLLFSLAAFPAFSSESESRLENEKNTIGIFKNSVNSVVNVSNIMLARKGWLLDYDVMEVPAGQGSGFIWDNDGHIVTNYHVIANGDNFLVSFHNDTKQYKAKLVGAEPSKDIAVLKLEERPTKIQPVSIGDSRELIVGQKALAIGNPFGLDHTITEGIISALDRRIQGIGGVSIHGMIQTDCSINPGNSGGPLLDSSGKVVGMNTMIFSNSGSSAGIGFAVPSYTISEIVPQLIKHGKVIRPGLGIGILEDRIKRQFNIKEGIVVKYVDQSGPAGVAGLRGMGRDQRGRYYLGDIITNVGSQKVDSYDDIFHALDKFKVGDEVEVQYLRDGEKKKVKMKLKAL